MIFNVGDYVTRESYNNDVLFKVLKIENDKAYLKGVELRLLADAPLVDLKLSEGDVLYSEDEKILNEGESLRNDKYFYLPGKVLHLDGDSEYLERCLNFYKKNKILAIGKKIKEENMSNQVLSLLKEYRPDILIITGHDAYNKKSKNLSDLKNYKNSINFVKSVKEARKYEKSHEKLVIIAGACQSDYEELIKAGANFASSPKRVNIHALDPAIIAVVLASTERGQEIDLIELLSKTKYGAAGIGGIISRGLMYVGYPRS